ncbi:MAG: preprotein translocase subunit SecY [Rickettsiales bacterium]|nr:preprotein translocase subunit SecY [Rickettsiales bacterium]|tara:strand:+ start:792 stop:2159 length:1368 start_codon:yes stop_codon:yes gene_type:complete
MTSAAERLAANMNIGMLARAGELKKRLLFVLGALVVYRIGTYIPIPGVDPLILNQIFQQQQGGVLGVFNMFSGGALGRMTIFALAVMPYISASIIMQLLSVTVPSLQQLKKEGEAGRRKINQYTRYGTVVLSLAQSYGIAVGLEGMQAPAGGSAVLEPGVFFRFSTMVTLTGGTLFLMWLGEQITQRGIGQGISLIIFTGIVAELPGAVAATMELGRENVIPTAVLLLVLAIALGLMALIVFVERAQRRILIQYPKRQMGNRLVQGESQHLPLKLNTAGVIPPIFASSILLFPLTIANFNEGGGPEWLQLVSTYIAHGQPLYIALYVAIIIFFCFFYTSVVFNPDDTADNLKKNGGFIAGIRPGKNTADYLDYVLTRLTAVGAIYLALVCTLPELLIAKYAIPFYLGGTSLLILVNVLMDFIGQVQSHLFAHQYEGLIKQAKLRGSGKQRQPRMR